MTEKRSGASTPSVPVFEGEVTQEIQLSEDVIIRPARTTTVAPQEPVVTSAETSDTPLSHDVPTQETSHAPTDTVDEPAAESPVEVVQGTDTSTADDADEDLGDAFEVPVDVQESVAMPATVGQTSRRSPAVSLSTFVNDTADEDMASQEPRREFDYLLNRVLMVIRSATNARTAAFLWVNSERQQLVVEAKITEAEAEFTEQRKLPMGMDALSQIAREGRPEIITQISAAAEMELLPYYDRPAGTISFIGVPVYYGGNVVGILCADSQIEDAYSDITVGFFGQFTKLISGLVSSYTSKYDLMLASSKLEALEQLRGAIGETSVSIQSVTRALFGTVIQNMDVSRIGLVSYDAGSGGWSMTDARSAMDDNYRSLVGSPIDVHQSAVGSCITSASTVILSQDLDGLRVVDGEPPVEFGQFVAVALRTSKECFGALYLENLEATLSSQDIALAEALAEHVATIFEQLHQTQSLKGAALLDHATGVLNTNGFEMRVREEFARSIDYNIPLTVCMLQLDPSRATPEQRMHAMLHVLRLVKEQLRDYDVVARMDEEQIALALIGYKLQEAQNWTETMRREVASTPVEIAGKRLAFTTSIGIAQAEPRDTWDDLIAHAQAAVEVSLRTGNKVTVFA
jgi:diguanylate cyclase (GGDEF)-like protein